MPHNPTITNDTTMTPAQVLAAYHYQPNLERRHHMLKGPQDVAPVYLETPHRIEALLLCHFLAMLAGALIEREIRTGPFPVWWTHGLDARINREKIEWVRHAVVLPRSTRQKRLPLSWTTIGR
jgi:transposase